MVEKIELTEEQMAEVIAEAKQHEVQYTVTKEYAEPVKYFADWCSRYDKLIAEVQFSDGSAGYLGVAKSSGKGVEYLLDEQYCAVAKTCNKTRVMLRLEHYGTDNSGGKFGVKTISKDYASLYGKQYCKHYYKDNRDRMLQYFKQYYMDNSNKISQYNKQWRNDNMDKISQYRKQYYRGNSDKVLVYSKQYSKDNPHKRKAARQRRKVKLKDADALLSAEQKQWHNDFELRAESCWLTGHPSVNFAVETEHLMPINATVQLPYQNTETNLYRLLKPLNSSKNDSNVFDWIDSMTEEHLQFLLRDYDVTLSLDQFVYGMNRIITELAAKQGLTFEQYKEQYNADYSAGMLQEVAV